MTKSYTYSAKIAAGVTYQRFIEKFNKHYWYWGARKSRLCLGRDGG